MEGPETNVSVDSAVSQEPQPSILQRWLQKARVASPPGLTVIQRYLYNPDLRPVEEVRREWGWSSYVCFWISESFSISSWQLCSDGIGRGLEWWQAWLAVIVGYYIAGFLAALSAEIGTKKRTAFPITCRISCGHFFSLWPVAIRLAMACVSYSIAALHAGSCIALMLKAVFAKNVEARIPDRLPDKNITSYQYMCFMVFWAVSLPFLWIAPENMKNVFKVKACIVPLAGLGFLIWSVVKAQGAGPIVLAKAQLRGSAVAWPFVKSTMVGISRFAPLIANALDYSRFSKLENFKLGMLLHSHSIVFCFTLTSLLGLLVSSSSESLYGEPIWDPMAVLDRYLNTYTAGNRAGVFLIALAFAFCQIGTNISANSISFGTSFSTVIPRYINIRRGSYLCALLALAVQPWDLEATNSRKMRYISAGGVFLSAITGVMVADFYEVRRGYLKVQNLYQVHDFDKKDPSVLSPHMYNKLGTNWRAVVAYAAGFIPTLISWVLTYEEPSNAASGISYLTDINYVIGFATSSTAYTILGWLFPPDGLHTKIEPKKLPHPNVCLMSLSGETGSGKPNRPTKARREKILTLDWYGNKPDVEKFEDQLFGPQNGGTEGYTNETKALARRLPHLWADLQLTKSQ